MYEELVKNLRENVRDGCSDCTETAPLILQAADAIEELSKANQIIVDATLKFCAAHMWIPVTERLPEKDDDVLMYAEWTGVSGTIYKDISLSTISELKNMEYRVSHWMPLPEPPESEGE